MDPFFLAAVYVMVTASFWGGLAIGKNQEQNDQKLKQSKR